MALRRPSDIWNDNQVNIDVGDTLTLSGNVTLDAGSLVGLRGNVTLSDSKGFIGLVTAVTNFSGNVTLDAGSKTQISGNVTLSDSKGFIGSVSVGGGTIGLSGNITISDSKGFIGLSTIVVGTPYPASGNVVNGAVGTGGIADIALVAAAGASTKTYVGSAQVVNTGTANSLIQFKDGNAGAILGYTVAPAGGGSNIIFTPPLVTSANVTLNFNSVSSTATVWVSVQTYKAP